MGTEARRGHIAGSALPKNCVGWGRRALLFTILFVFVATLFPFQFLPHETASRRTPFVLLWLTPELPSPRDIIENVVFFLPLGFSLACWWGKKGWRHLGRVWAAGAALSLLVEYLQVFLPTRTAQWSDVIANSMGSALGFLISERAGLEIVRFALRLEARIERFFTLRRIAIAFGAYCALMFFCSAALQQSTNLTHWAADDRLIVGNDAAQRHSWQGRILRIDVADQAIAPEDLRREASTQDRENVRSPSASPQLLLHLSAETHSSPEPLRADTPAKDLIGELHQTNQFTLQVLCAPSETAMESVGTLVSLARDPHHVDFVLGENRGRWLAGIRSALAGRTRRWYLSFSGIPKAGQHQEITVSFDGSKLSAFVDGQQAGWPLCLNPGAILASVFKDVGAHNVYGYGILYDALVFVPMGFLMALAARKPARGNLRWILPVLLLAPPLLEGVLVAASQRPFHVGNVILGEGLIVGAFLLLNSDRRNFGRRLDDRSKSA